MRLRWSVALLTVLTMSIVQAQMPTMTSVQAGGWTDRHYRSWPRQRAGRAG